MAKKKRQATDQKEESTIPAKKAENYLPPLPDGEDSESIMRHISSMKEEYKSKKPNYEKVNLLLNRTLHDRRKRIVTESASVKDIIEDYPFLTHSNQLLNEYKRITNADVFSAISAYLSESADEILDSFSGSRKFADHFLHSTLSDQENKNTVALFAANILLGEDPLVYIGQNRPPPKEVPVYIKVDFKDAGDLFQQNLFEIYADGFKLCEASTLLTAYAVHVACYYIFNMQYCSASQKSMMLIEKIANVNSRDPITKKEKENKKKVISFIAKVNSSPKGKNAKKKSKTRK